MPSGCAILVVRGENVLYSMNSKAGVSHIRPFSVGRLTWILLRRLDSGCGLRVMCEQPTSQIHTCLGQLPLFGPQRSMFCFLETQIHFTEESSSVEII